MNLADYADMKVIIHSTAGNIVIGTVGDYCYPEDDENGLEMIVVDAINGRYAGKAIGFYEKDIKSIKVIE